MGLKDLLLTFLSREIGLDLGRSDKQIYFMHEWYEDREEIKPLRETKLV